MPHPILAKAWRRITFFYTTGEYLLVANTIEELILEEDDRRPVWQALRERASHSQRYDADIPGVEIDAALLAALLGLKR
jgi:hypothetical protein